MAEEASGHADTRRPGALRTVLGLAAALFLTVFGNLIAAVLAVAYLVLLLVISVIAGIVFGADAGLGVFLAAFGLSTVVPVVLGLRRYRREHPERFRNDLREAVVAWTSVLVFTVVVGGLIVLVLNLVA